jgi:NAD(P)-dependent dehydrogenase (short-subunit alcohol dehydrogenase family)
MVALVYQHFGRIDILVNNAGQGYDAPIEKIDPEVVHRFLI